MDKKYIDWPGKRYEAIRELGEHPDIIIGSYNWVSKRLELDSYPHEKCDGIGAITNFLSKKGVRIKHLPQIKSRLNSSLLKTIYNFFIYQKLLKPHIYPWKNHSVDKKEGCGVIGYCLFNEKQTEEIISYCKEQSITVTNLFSWILFKTTENKLLSKSCYQVWNIPVNLRGLQKKEEVNGNYVAGIPVGIEPGSNPKEIGIIFNRLYDMGLYWGVRISSDIIKYIGIKRYKKILQKKELPLCIGTCSNLGIWPPKEYQGKVIDNVSIVGAPPVSRLMPISAMIITWNGKLSLGVQLHSSIVIDSKDTKYFVQDFYTTLRKTVSFSSEEKNETIVGLRSVKNLSN